jgi:type I restriction enzyme, S subunit
MSEKNLRQRVRLKYLANIEMGQSPPSTQYSDSQVDGLPFLQGTADFGSVSPSPKVCCGAPTKQAKAKDILFSVRAPVGELNKADQDYGIGRGLCAIRPKTSWSGRFAWWALHEARYQLNFVSTGSTYEAVATEDVGNLLVEFPEPNVQRSIADYLDRETARIDALIAAKVRLLELLAEKRRALITRAVTRGLNPDVPLRDSGIPWLGEIPAHWETIPIKRIVTRVGSGVSVNAANEPAGPEDVGVLKTSAVSAGRFFPNENKCVLPSEIARVSCPVTADRVIMSRMNTPLLVGEVGYVDDDHRNLFLPDRLWQIEFDNHRGITRYMTLVMASPGLRSVYAELATGTSGSMKNLSQEDVLAIKVPLPPLLDQHAIVEHISRETEKLDKVTAATERTIALFKERRTALIAAAVTGQIDVGGTA